MWDKEPSPCPTVNNSWVIIIWEGKDEHLG